MIRLDGKNLLKSKSSFCFDYNIEDKEYRVEIVYPSATSNYKNPYILVLPKQINDNSLLAVEVNNLETENEEQLINNGLLTAYHLTVNLKEYNNPILIPIIPSVRNGVPYYQQLSRECFFIPSDNSLYRIDLQVLNIINEVKQKISNIAKINEKIFLNGYSSSGVFAQRFALLHPEIIDTLCVGGASGSIPIPTEKLEYPIGIADYESLTDKPFDLESYSKIKFRYYVGELEIQNKSDSRFDDFGQPASKHDMSYFDRSVPTTVGKKQRDMFGKNLFERAINEISLMREIGLDIEQTIFENRTHNNSSGLGVNELGDDFVSKTYQQSIISSRIK